MIKNEILTGKIEMEKLLKYVRKRKSIRTYMIRRNRLTGNMIERKMEGGWRTIIICYIKGEISYK